MALANDIVTYNAQSSLRRPSVLFKEMVGDLFNSRELAWRLFVRDLSSQYKQTLIGFLWAFFPPLVMTFVFVFLNKSQVIKAPSLENVPAPLFILVGMLFWQLFADCLVNPLKIVESSRALIIKVSFPRESLVLASIGQSFANFIVRLVLLLVACIWYRFAPPLASVPSFLFGSLVLTIFGTCLGLLILPLGLLFKDFAQAITLSLTFLLFLSPVGYYLDLSSTSAWYFKWNPLVYLVNYPRDGFFGIDFPYFMTVLPIFGVSIGFLLIGWVVFRISIPIIFERLGA